jgi:hypothetical protein
LKATIRFISLAFLASLALLAHDLITTNLTYTRDVSRIFARRCVSCHGVGASIPLTTYEEARPWAVAIKEQVLSRSMPPWGAVKGFGNLAKDGALNQEELMIIAAWVIGGAPKGDPSLLPKDPPPVKSADEPSTTDGLVIDTRGSVTRPLRAVGLRTISPGKVDSARITARLPDGRIEPLVWLYRYDAKYRSAFYFKDSIELPAGSTIESSTPLQFALQVAGPKQQARR